jgi:hypothetical protein
MSLDPGDGMAERPRPDTPRELQAVVLRERDQGPFLLHRDGRSVLCIVDLVERDRPVVVGRSAPADLVLAWDPQVSRVHCLFEHIASEWTLQDDGLSRNGTFLNGARVTARTRLRSGDLIRAGRTMLEFRDPAVAFRVEGTEIAADDPQRADLTDAQRRVLVALCRPLLEGRRTPATNPEISREVFLGVDAVKVHLRAMYGKFDLEGLAQNEKRARLSELALRWALVTERDL